MQVNLDSYYRNIRMFYQQLIKGHKDQEELSLLFKKMLENQSRKWRKGYHGRGMTSNTAQGVGILAKLKEHKGAKDKNKIVVDVLYASTNVQNMVVFGYCYLTLQYKNNESFEVLTQGLKEPLADKKMLSDMMRRKVHNLWDKMQQIVSGRRRIVRFEKQLQQCFKDMPQPIMDILYSIVTKKQQLPPSEPLQTYLTEAAQLFQVKIDYFELNEYDNLKLQAYNSQSKNTMRFGLWTKEKIFGYVSQMPTKEEVQINKEATLGKFAEISQQLNGMYAVNLKEYMGLTNLKTGKIVRRQSQNTNISQWSGKSTLGKMKKAESQYTQI